jgi:prepilin-type processing-associated H-X9-DG protein
MDENLVGYLLKALDPDAERAVADYLASDPEAERRLELLRQVLEPLGADIAAPTPPPGLAVRTLACVAEYCCRQLPPAPKLPATRGGGGAPRRWWRRADVLVAATVLLTVGLLVPSTVNWARHKEQITLCKDNLRKFGFALHKYRDQHKGAFPTIKDEKEPFKVAGLFVPVLHDAGVLPDDVSVRCPAQGLPKKSPWSLAQLREMTPEEFQQKADDLACCYAYSLGFRDPQGRYEGPRAEPNPHQSLVPLLADAPPFDDPRLGNSPNHGGAGQNVLFLDGHVTYHRTRNVGFEGDDIYLNKAGEVKAGLDRLDAVLGRSAARP